MHDTRTDGAWRTRTDGMPHGRSARMRGWWATMWMRLATATAAHRRLSLCRKGKERERCG
jgi:hypothetical protein